MNERVMQFRVGVMVLATLLIGGILVMLFNEPRDLISAVVPSMVSGGKYTVRIKFEEAPNVDTHTPVRKSGIRIGRVSEVELLEAGGVLVTAKIDGNRRLRHNEVFHAVSDLLGDAVLKVVPGDPADPDTFIEDGEPPLEGKIIWNIERNLPALIAKVETSATALTEASDKMGAAADEIRNLLQANRQRIDDTVAQAGSTLQAVEKVAEDLDSLIGDPQVQQRLRTAIHDFPEVIGRAKKVVSMAESRIDELAPFTQTLGSRELNDRVKNVVKNLDQVTQDFVVFSRRLRSPQGTLGLLMNDRQLYDRLDSAVGNIDELTRRFKPIVSDLRVFSDKIARHPESLGVRGALQRNMGVK